MDEARREKIYLIAGCTDENVKGYLRQIIPRRKCLKFYVLWCFTVLFISVGGLRFSNRATCTSNVQLTAENITTTVQKFNSACC